MPTLARAVSSSRNAWSILQPFASPTSAHFLYASRSRTTSPPKSPRVRIVAFRDLRAAEESRESRNLRVWSDPLAIAQHFSYIGTRIVGGQIGPVMEPAELAHKAGAPDAGISGSCRTRRCRGAPEAASATGFRGRSAKPDGGTWPGGRRQGLPAPGWRLRGEFRRIPSRQYPRHVPRALADGSYPDLCGGNAGREGGKDCRPIRETSIGRLRDARRHHASVLPWRQRQRRGVHGRGADTRS